MAGFSDAPATELLMTFTDKDGKHSKVRVWLAGLVTDLAAAGPAAIIAASAALSDALMSKAELIPHALNTDAVGTYTGAYVGSADKSRFIFKTTAGSLVTQDIPTVKEAIMKANGIDIDQTNTDVAAYIAYVIAHQKGPAGEAIASLVSAQRVRSKFTKTQAVGA